MKDGEIPAAWFERRMNEVCGCQSGPQSAWGRRRKRLKTYTLDIGISLHLGLAKSLPVHSFAKTSEAERLYNRNSEK